MEPTEAAESAVGTRVSCDAPGRPFLRGLSGFLEVYKAYTFLMGLSFHFCAAMSLGHLLPCRRAAPLLGTLAANRLAPTEGRDARGTAWRWW